MAGVQGVRLRKEQGGRKQILPTPSLSKVANSQTTHWATIIVFGSDKIVTAHEHND